MSNTLRWRIPNQQFEDGSKIADWKKNDGNPWHLQIERDYEMTFDIYEHDGQIWKLYQGCWVIEGTTEYYVSLWWTSLSSNVSGLSNAGAIAPFWTP